MSYFQRRTAAREQLDAKQYATAELVAEQLVREYPRDGENWVLLGKVKSGLHKYLEAAVAYEAAGGILGWDYLAHDAATSYLAADRRADALRVLRTWVDDHGLRREQLWDWPEFSALRDDPEFRSITARPNTSGLNRVEGWRGDIDHLYNAVRRINPVYHSLPFPDEFERRYAALKADVPRLSDEEIFVGMGRMLAVLRQGHVGVYPPSQNRYLPVQMYTFPEGVYVIDAADAYRELIGARVIEVGNTPVDELLARVASAHSVDGEMQHLWNTADLSSGYYLKGLGAIGALDSAVLLLRRSDGSDTRVTLRLEDKPIAARLDKLVDPRGVQAPLFLRYVHRDIERMYWEQFLPERDALYIQMNQVRNERTETLPAFGKRMRTIIDSSGVQNVVVDVRNNNGGTDALLTELVTALASFSQKSGHRLFVLIGRRTYSAAATFITLVERFAHPVFVGEPSSECCNFHGFPTVVVLPYSRISAELTTTKFVGANPWDTRREMVPDVPVLLTAQAYFAGRDPALEAIFSILDKSRLPGK